MIKTIHGTFELLSIVQDLEGNVEMVLIEVE